MVWQIYTQQDSTDSWGEEEIKLRANPFTHTSRATLTRRNIQRVTFIFIYRTLIIF